MGYDSICPFTLGAAFRSNPFGLVLARLDHQWANLELTAISTLGKIAPWAKPNDRPAPNAGRISP